MSSKSIKNFRYISNQCTGCFYLPFSPLLTLSLSFFLSFFLLSSTSSLLTVWKYGLSIWECTSISNYLLIQRFQNKISRILTGPSLYVSNRQLYADFHLPKIQETASIHASNYIRPLYSIPNVEALVLLIFPTNKQETVLKVESCFRFSFLIKNFEILHYAFAESISSTHVL